jgi:hypothetical protein
MAGEARVIGSALKEATNGAVQIIVLALLVVSCIGVAVAALLLMVAII